VKYLLFGAVGLALLPSKCGSGDPAPTDPSSVPISVTVTGPPLATSGPQLVVAQPVSAFGDAGPAPGEKSVYEQSKEYHELGQNWVARLLIEKRALGEAGTKDDVELLLSICKAQRDAGCVQSCAQKLGRKIAFDAGAPASPSTPLIEHPSETPFSKARDLHLKKRDKEARAILEPRVIDGKAPAEETKLLLDICTVQNDKMCIALCKKQLGG